MFCTVFCYDKIINLYKRTLIIRSLTTLIAFRKKSQTDAYWNSQNTVMILSMRGIVLPSMKQLQHVGRLVSISQCNSIIGYCRPAQSTFHCLFSFEDVEVQNVYDSPDPGFEVIIDDEVIDKKCQLDTIYYLNLKIFNILVAKKQFDNNDVIKMKK